MDASEDSQLRAAIAASLACTTSTKQTESSSDDDDDEDFDDLEFSGSDSDISPQKNVAKPSTITSAKTEVKRGINFDESAEKTQETSNKESKLTESEHLNSNDSVKNKNGQGGVAKISYKTSETNKTQVSEVDSKEENKDDSSNQRTQEQAGELTRTTMRSSYCMKRTRDFLLTRAVIFPLVCSCS